MRRLLLLLAFALFVLATLAIRPLWVDELNQLLGTRGTTAQLLQWSLTGPGGAPLAYMTQQWVMAAFGFSTFTARIPAALFGIAAVAVFYLLARQWRIRQALATTVLFAFLPIVLRYTQEARPYSQALFFALLMLYAWPKRPVVLGIAALLGLYTQPFTAFPAAALGLMSLLRRQWINAAALVLAMLLFLPWLYFAHQTAVQAHTMAQFFFSWHQVTPGVLLRELAGGSYLVTLPLLALAACGYTRAGEFARLSVVVLAFCLIGPIVADAAAGYFFASRQLIFAIPVLVLLAGFALESAAVVYAIAGLLLIASLVKDVRYLSSVREDWATAAQALRSQLTPDTCILVAPPKSLEYFAVYDPSLLARGCPEHPTAGAIIAVQTPYSTPAEQEKANAQLGAGYDQTRTASAGGMNFRLLRRYPAQ